MKCTHLHIGLLMLALIAASGQCSMACASAPCSRHTTELPPCHQHSPKPMPSACAQSMFAAVIGPIPNADTTPIVTIAFLPLRTANTDFLPEPVRVTDLEKPPPLNPHVALSTILQV